MYNNTNSNNVFGIIGCIVGLLGAGYAVAMHTKLSKISERLDAGIDELANRTDIDIPDELIHQAVEKAAAAEAKKAVEKATSEALATLKQDIKTTVTSAVDAEYEHIHESVLAQTTASAARIDVARVRKDVETAAKEAALKNFNANLDDILDSYKENLSNVSRIYSSIAQATTRTTDVGKEVVFKLN